MIGRRRIEARKPALGAMRCRAMTGGATATHANKRRAIGALRTTLVLLALLVVASLIGPASSPLPGSLLIRPAQAAVDPREMLPDPAAEARARDIGRNLRCLVCQNQSIDDSDAPLARDLRRVVRERITLGEDDASVMAFVVARYGDFVLMRPPIGPATLLLYAAPVLLLGGGLVIVWRFLRGRSRSAEALPLSAEEQARLDQMLERRS